MNILSIVFPQNKTLHNMHDNEMNEIMCPLAEGIVFFSKYKCVLRTCDSFPLYNFLQVRK